MALYNFKKIAVVPSAKVILFSILIIIDIYCKSRLPETEVTCDKCKNTIHFCIATGRHIVEDDFTVCPQCDFPAIRSEFLRIVESEETCPMCSERVNPEMVSFITDIHPYLDYQEEKKA